MFEGCSNKWLGFGGLWGFLRGLLVGASGCGFWCVGVILGTSGVFGWFLPFSVSETGGKGL